MAVLPAHPAIHIGPSGTCPLDQTIAYPLNIDGRIYKAELLPYPFVPNDQVYPKHSKHLQSLVG